jgi:hypothetical protein
VEVRAPGAGLLLINEIQVRIHNRLVQASADEFHLVGSTIDHPSAHWMTPVAIERLRTVIAAFREQKGVIPLVNDMSLEWGGRFDLGPRYKSAICPTPQYWIGPCSYAEHKFGTNADIGGLGEYREFFRNLAEEACDDCGRPYREGTHIHLRLSR